MGAKCESFKFEVNYNRPVLEDYFGSWDERALPTSSIAFVEYCDPVGSLIYYLNRLRVVGCHRLAHAFPGQSHVLSRKEEECL